MEKNLLLSKLAMASSRIMLEDTADQIVVKTTNRRAEAGKKLPRYYRDISRDKDGNAVVHFEVLSSKSAQEQSDAVSNDTTPPSPHRYQCYIDLIPEGTTLFAIAQGTTKLADRINVIKNANVKVFCSCPDFNWSGMKYNNKHINDTYSAGHHSDNPDDDHGEDINPIKRDPKHKNYICKHLYAALFGLKPFAAQIMRDAKNAPAPAPAPTQKPEQNTDQTTEQSPYDENGETTTEQAPEQTKEQQDAIYEFESTNTIPKDGEVSKALNDFGDMVETNYDFGEPNENVPVDEDAEAHEDETEKKADDVYDFSTPKPNGMADLAEESKLDMFNQPVDDEEPEQDSVYQF